MSKLWRRENREGLDVAQYRRAPRFGPASPKNSVVWADAAPAVRPSAQIAPEKNLDMVSSLTVMAAILHSRISFY